jgi:hypothetical protein
MEMNSKIQAQAIALGWQITYIDEEAAQQASRNDYGPRMGLHGYGAEKGKVQ